MNNNKIIIEYYYRTNVFLIHKKLHLKIERSEEQLVL